MIPPRWMYRAFWALHRAVDRASGGRIGTRRPTTGRVGTLFLLTRGRRSGQVRRNGLFYVEDGPNLVVAASNAGAPNDPAWWLNLQAQPDAEVHLPGSTRAVRARRASADERARLWSLLVAGSPPYAEYEQATSREIAVVVLEPR